MVKFKIGFTIDAETMFHMMSRFLPIDDLSVQELPPTPTVGQLHAKILARSQPLRPAPLPLEPRRKRKPTRAMTLEAGINRVLIEALADGKPHAAFEMKPMVVKAGYSANSVTSRLQALMERGIVKHRSDGTWIADLVAVAAYPKTTMGLSA